MHCHIQLKKKASLCVFSWFWMLRVVQQGSLLFDFQSPWGSLGAGKVWSKLADGAHAPVQGISEGRREPESLSPPKPAPGFPFVAQGVSTRCSWKSLRLMAPRAYPGSLSLLQGLMVSPPVLWGVCWQHLGVSCCDLFCSPRPWKEQWLWHAARAASGKCVTKREQWISLVLSHQRDNHVHGKERAILQAALKDVLNPKSRL